MKIISQNKKAHHDYFLLDTYEAGIELKGTEIKSVRLGNVNLKGLCRKHAYRSLRSWKHL